MTFDLIEGCQHRRRAHPARHRLAGDLHHHDHDVASAAQHSHSTTSRFAAMPRGCWKFGASARNLLVLAELLRSQAEAGRRLKKANLEYVILAGSSVHRSKHLATVAAVVQCGWWFFAFDRRLPQAAVRIAVAEPPAVRLCACSMPARKPIAQRRHV